MNSLLGMSHNTWCHRIIRPIVRRLVDSPVTPNHLTTLRLATAVLSGVMLAAGDRDWANAAGVVFLISMFLDRADGELARQSGKSTPWGHRFDLISDYSANVLIFLGIGIGLSGGALGSGAIALGLLAGCAITGILWLVSRIERIDGIGAAAFPTTGGFDPDDAMLIVPIAIWLDSQQAILIAAAIGAPTFLLWTWWRFRRYLVPS